MKLRKFHRFLGLLLFIFVMSSAATGFLRANAKGLYWKDRPPKTEAAFLSLPQIGIEEVFKAFGENFSSGNILRIRLEKFSDKQVYLVETDRQDKKYMLLDAVSGAILSPLGPGDALKVARLFVGENAQALLTERLPAFKAGKSGRPRPVFRILFDDRARTEVFVDQETGEALAVFDRGRRFGLWVVKLHELDFWGLGRGALSFLGLALMVLSVSGLALGTGLGQNKKKGRLFQ